MPALLCLVTIVNSQSAKYLNAIAGMPEFCKFCREKAGKGSISRMSDECLMKQETVFSFCVVYQAVMRKFTLAGKTYLS